MIKRGSKQAYGSSIRKQYSSSLFIIFRNCGPKHFCSFSNPSSFTLMTTSVPTKNMIYSRSHFGPSPLLKLGIFFGISSKILKTPLICAYPSLSTAAVGLSVVDVTANFACGDSPSVFECHLYLLAIYTKLDWQDESAYVLDDFNDSSLQILHFFY